MTELTRRTLLAGAAAAAATPLAASAPARAAAPLAGAQAPGWYRYKVGDFEITVVTDGMARFKLPDNLVTNVKREEVNAALAAVHLPPDFFVSPYNPIVVNTGQKLVLIDTGTSETAFNSTKGATGQLLANLPAAGIDPKAIDIVVVSHLHPDHTNGIKGPDGALVFPNAEIKVPAVDWAFWMSDENMAKASSDMMKAYFQNVRKILADQAGKVSKYEWGQEVAPGMTAIDAHGHTPGHTAFAVASGSARVLIQSDVTNIPELFLRHPDWHVVFDVDPLTAAQTRHKIYDMAAAERMTVVGFHFQFPSIGHVEKEGAGYRLVPSAWNPVI